MNGAYSVPYRVESLQTNLGITPVDPALVALWNRSPIDDVPGDFDLDKLNLESITKKDSGECLFACIAMAVYGTEDRHSQVRTAVCDFIQHMIIPNYHSLSNVDKVSLMMKFNMYAEEPCSISRFQKTADKYISNMRKKNVCGQELELSVACYIFRIKIMLLKKNTVLRSKKSKSVTYSRHFSLNGYDLTIEGMQLDGIGSLPTATPNKAAKIESVVMMFCEIKMVPDGKAEAGPALHHTQEQAAILAKEDQRVGHYELMAKRSGGEGSGKQKAGKKQKSHHAPTGDQDGVGQGNSDEDTDLGHSSDIQGGIKQLEKNIRVMMERERSLIHEAHKKQKKCDKDLQEHMEHLKRFPDASNTHTEARGKKLHEDASNCGKKTKENEEKLMYEICMAQASVREQKRRLKGCTVQDDKRFDKYMEQYMTEATKRRALNIEQHNHDLHNHGAGPLKSIVSKHDIDAIKIQVSENKVTLQMKKGRSDRRLVGFQSEISELKKTQATMPTPMLYDPQIQKIQTQIETEENYRINLVGHAENLEAHLAFMEAENNGLGEAWIQVNPTLFKKFGHLKTSNS